jgi:hypothetical protein
VARSPRKKKGEVPPPPENPEAAPPEEQIVLTDEEKGALKEYVQLVLKLKEGVAPLAKKIDLERLGQYGKQHPDSGIAMILAFKVEKHILNLIGLGDGELEAGTFGISVIGVSDPGKIPVVIPPDYPLPAAVAAVNIIVRSIARQGEVAAVDLLTDIIISTVEELSPLRSLLASLNRQAGAFFGKLIEQKQAEAFEKMHREKGEAPS